MTSLFLAVVVIETPSVDVAALGCSSVEGASRAVASSRQAAHPSGIQGRSQLLRVCSRAQVLPLQHGLAAHAPQLMLTSHTHARCSGRLSCLHWGLRSHCNCDSALTTCTRRLPAHLLKEPPPWTRLLPFYLPLLLKWRLCELVWEPWTLSPVRSKVPSSLREHL